VAVITFIVLHWHRLEGQREITKTSIEAKYPRFGYEPGMRQLSIILNLSDFPSIAFTFLNF